MPNLLTGIIKSLKDADSISTNSSFGWQARTKIHVARRYISVYYETKREPGGFEDVRSYCLFVGHARSGGSMLGALLDAHRSIVLADEVDIFQYIKAGFDRDQLFRVLTDRAREQAQKGKSKDGRDGKTYSYYVPNQWQGKVERLLVVGNRKAGISTQRLRLDPHFLDDLHGLLGSIDLKLVHSIRNPYDTIATMSIRSGRSLESGIRQYFANCETIAKLKHQAGDTGYLGVRHEELIRNPQACLREACHFLGVDAPEDYLDSCAGILYKKPAVSRHKIEWTPEQIESTAREIEKYEFLKGYSFDA